MNVLDYIIIGLAVAGVVLGLFRGFIKLVLTAVGVIVVSTLTATVEPYVQNWFVKTSMEEGTRNFVAMVVTIILLTLAYAFLAFLVGRALKKIKIVGFLDRLLGAAVGFTVVYLVFALVFALFNITSEGFMPLLKSSLGDSIKTSWIGTHLYKNNFFGTWIINGIAKKLIEGLQPTEPQALAGLIALFA